MRRAHRLGVALAYLLPAWATVVFALDPSLDVSQYAHTSWRFREGFSKGAIHDIAQTRDGYLWLGTEFGLLRFDGVRNVPWQPPSGQHLPSGIITKLLTARDGTLWIGTRNGLSSWKNDRLVSYAELSGKMVFALLEDREGTMWAGALGVPEGKLCEIRNGAVQCHPEIGQLGHGAFGLYEDRKGNLWVGLLTGLWRWRPGTPEFFPAPGEPNGIQGMTEDKDGQLLIPMIGGIRRLFEGKLQINYPFPPALKQLQAHSILRDRDGGFWVGTLGAGVVHIHQGRTDVLSEPDGLTGSDVTDLFEDREGNVWVATGNGLDRFRELPVVTYSLSQGLSNSPAGSLLVSKDGSIWFGAFDALDRLRDGQVTVYRATAGAKPGVRQMRGLPPGVGVIFQDSRGRIWAGTRAGVGYIDGDRFILTRATGAVQAIVEDNTGSLWTSNITDGLVRLSRPDEIQRIPWAALGRKDPARSLAPDRSHGGIWLGYYMEGGLAYYRDGRVRGSYSTSDGLGAGHVSDLRFDRENALWIATESGLSRLKKARITTISSRHGLPCDTIHWTIEDDAGSVWMDTACGLVRAPRVELEAAADSPDHTGPVIHTALFDNGDGVRMTAESGGYTGRAAKSADGKLWFTTPDGISVVDPRRISSNPLPPPVQIEQIAADRKTYQASANVRLRLPPLARDIQIDYTALSLAAPEKIRFRYKLEGHDADWQDAGNRRQAFYNDLPPRNYRFRVIASNNSGVWNEAGAFQDFSVAPAYHQTAWFRASAAAAFLALLAALYQLRMRYLQQQFALRMEERVNERTRIARDLHDTLLQSLAGVSLQLDGIAKQHATHPEKTPSLISRVREQVDYAFREARVKVWNLRSPALEGQGLAEALRQLVDRIGPALEARCPVTVSGEPRSCPPQIEEELLRIAQEAIHNANRHARADEIHIALEYGRNALTLSISDNGRGFELDKGFRKTGHWGLTNMNERAAQIRGVCKITTAPGQGTRVQVHVPLSSRR